MSNNIVFYGNTCRGKIKLYNLVSCIWITSSSIHICILKQHNMSTCRQNKQTQRHLVETENENYTLQSLSLTGKMWSYNSLNKSHLCLLIPPGGLHSTTPTSGHVNKVWSHNCYINGHCSVETRWYMLVVSSLELILKTNYLIRHY